MNVYDHTQPKREGAAMSITTLGIDLAKNIFQLHGVDKSGKAVLKKKIRRKDLRPFIAQLPPCVIAIEACASSNYWTRQFKKEGHTVRAISPQFVKPYVKTNKNDANDAEAICEAAQRPNMRFVPEKSIEQQDIQSAHRIRQRLVRNRTALINEMRGLLNEYGVIIPAGAKKFRKLIPEILIDENPDLTTFFRDMLAELFQELLSADQRIETMDRKILRIFKATPICQRLAEIEGVGPITATALIASVGDPSVFKNGRQMAAWLGLVPRQNSSGGRTKLQGISKRGDVYLRTLLIHGARATVLHVKDKTDRKSEWIKQKLETKGPNKTCVALANKNARVIWKLMMSGESYHPAA